MRHRGAVDTDARTGDGAGILIPLPRRFLAHEGQRLGASIDPQELGVAVAFVSDDTSGGDLHRIVEAAAAAEGLRVPGWRDVPIKPESLADRARQTMPRILHALLLHPPGLSTARAETHAHRARRRAEQLASEEGRRIYFSSFSFLTLTYKALVAADQLVAFYPDLTDAMVEAPFAVFHQCYSTNTAPTWERAQPFRLLCHNGEINTIAGNVHRMRSHRGRLGAWSEETLGPLVDEAGSDSAMLAP
ncbi:MAG: hypothetical protein ACT4PO_15770 [Actinomycetota bacterium]